MSFDAFCYSKSHAADIPGETQDSEMSKLKAFEILSFNLGASNNVNIGSVTGGGGAGKATFKSFDIVKRTDTASTGLFTALVQGKHIDDLFIVLRRSAGADKSDVNYIEFEFKLVMVEDINWSGASGMDICSEAVRFQYGATRIRYFQQDKAGKMSNPKEAIWSRVKNQASMSV